MSFHKLGSSKRERFKPLRSPTKDERRMDVRMLMGVHVLGSSQSVRNDTVATFVASPSKPLEKGMAVEIEMQQCSSTDS